MIQIISGNSYYTFRTTSAYDCFEFNDRVFSIFFIPEHMPIMVLDEKKEISKFFGDRDFHKCLYRKRICYIEKIDLVENKGII